MDLFYCMESLHLNVIMEENHLGRDGGEEWYSQVLAFDHPTVYLGVVEREQVHVVGPWVCDDHFLLCTGQNKSPPFLF